MINLFNMPAKVAIVRILAKDDAFTLDDITTLLNFECILGGSKRRCASVKNHLTWLESKRLVKLKQGNYSLTMKGWGYALKYCKAVG